MFLIKNKNKILLLAIFVIALIFRFYKFKESIYFAFDQARDAYISQDIIKKGDLKFIGPPISGNLGLFHGVLFWYLLAPLNAITTGNPIFISALFRIINAFGIFIVYAIGKRLFNSKVGLLSALLYATSFEQTQYSIYVGNPSLAVLAILLIFYGSSLLFYPKRNTKWSPLLMFSGAAISTQLNLMYFYTIFIVLIILFIFKKESLKIKFKYYLIAFLSSILILSTYILVEIKYDFRSIQLATKLLSQGFGILNPNESKYVLFWNKYLIMFKDNFFGLFNNNILLTILVILLTFLIIIKAKNNKKYLLLLVWIMGWVILMFFGGHLAYYTNAGLSVGLLIVFASQIIKLNKYLSIVLICLFIFGNIKQINAQNSNSLLVSFASQTMMKLSDEYRLIDYLYQHANNRGFTIRVTGIPYKVQTIWAYLFNYYGQKKYKYLPYWENENVLGFPGELPTPKEGTTCVRFRIVEPSRGIPQELIEEDLKIENYFSDIIDQQSIGHFLIETRIAKNKNCHDSKPLY